MNSQRRRIDHSGRMFIPMNVDGGYANTEFFSQGKILALITWLVVSAFYMATLVFGENVKLVGRLIFFVTWVFVSQLFIRYIIFDERYFYKAYQKRKLFANPTADVFWNIAMTKHTESGDILIFADGKIGVFVQFERGSIIGKNEEFTEQHYDALSDFYKELMLRKLKFVQPNIMEGAAKDPRNKFLETYVAKEKNENLKKVLGLQLGKIIDVTRNTLFETDYILVYTNDMDRMDTLLYDVCECCYKVLDGAYIGFDILSDKEAVEFHKEDLGVSYFDYNEATVNAFKQYTDDKSAITLKTLHLSNGSKVELNKVDIDTLKNYLTAVQNNDVTADNVDILKILGDKKFRKAYEASQNWGVDIKQLEQKERIKEEQKLNNTKTTKKSRVSLFNSKKTDKNKVETEKATQPNIQQAPQTQEVQKEASSEQFNTELNDDDYVEF